MMTRARCEWYGRQLAGSANVVEAPEVVVEVGAGRLALCWSAGEVGGEAGIVAVGVLSSCSIVGRVGVCVCVMGQGGRWWGLGG